MTLFMFADLLLSWYEENRRSLPWRGESDPYKVWVSEIILQQTRVQQGWDYYLRFIEAFPDVQTLAAAPEKQVLRLWQGLGYYSRALNMHCAAKQIMEKHHGIFPYSYDDLLKLKGVGNYTAAAVASIAYGLPYPAVDGNVVRFFSRIFGICDDVTRQNVRKQITDICARMMPPQQAGTFNQACMEFGAVWCTPRHPRCSDCPFAPECYALAHQMTGMLPVKNNRTVRKERYFHYLVHLCQDKTIIEKRTERDIWQNMYQFPLIETADNEPLHSDNFIAMYRKILTHQIIYARYYLLPQDTLPQPGKNQQIISVQDIDNYPMPVHAVNFIKEFKI